MPETTERDLVEEVEDLLTNCPVIKDAAYNVEHALFADAIERQRNSPFWGESKRIAQLYARSPELLRRLVERDKRNRDALKMMVELWDAEHPDDPCGCVGASDDCKCPPTCELCVARMLMEGRDPADA